MANSIEKLGGTVLEIAGILEIFKGILGLHLGEVALGAIGFLLGRHVARD